MAACSATGTVDGAIEVELYAGLIASAGGTVSAVALDHTSLHCLAVLFDENKAGSERSVIAELLAAAMDRPEWMRRAACRGMPAEVFYPTKAEMGEEAHAVCRRCPVFDECAGAGAGERYGFWAPTARSTPATIGGVSRYAGTGSEIRANGGPPSTPAAVRA